MSTRARPRSAVESFQKRPDFPSHFLLSCKPGGSASHGSLHAPASAHPSLWDQSPIRCIWLSVPTVHVAPSGKNQKEFSGLYIRFFEHLRRKCSKFDLGYCQKHIRQPKIMANSILQALYPHWDFWKIKTVCIWKITVAFILCLHAG